MQTLKGILKEIRFTGDDFWSVAIIEDDEGKEHTVVGNLFTVSPGDTIQLSGEWKVHPRYGEQFKFYSFEVLLPSTDEGIIGFLDGQLKNIGRTRAIEMITRFGRENVFDVIENHPERLIEIPGITLERAKEIHEDYIKIKHLRETLTFLKQYQLTDHQASKIIAKYGFEARDVLNGNPYQLIEDIDGFGFKTVDEIARKMGLDRNSIARAKAACIYFLKVAEDEGNIYVPTEIFRREVVKEIGINGDRIDRALGILKEDGAVVLLDGRVYSGRLYSAEMSIAMKLRTLSGEMNDAR